MTEQGFPNSHTTTTVVQPTSSKSNVHLDLSYLHTTDGRIKCGEIALNLIGFICVLSSRWKYESRGNWFNTVAMGGFWFSGIMLAFFLFHVPENLKMIPWVKVEFIFCAIWTLFYLIAASLAANWGSFDEAFAAAAVSGKML
ncbi:hypothetical protein RUM43_009587 [Polyplax serrata]|uniref:MARVEL domain-containing protein n=1 Tax=Polyplax serrata TaxID=468196 RepID=A0AAN8RUI4_POLSC